jgi:hypothetical protein
MTRPYGTLSSRAFDDGRKNAGCQLPLFQKLEMHPDPEHAAQPRPRGSGLGSAFLFERRSYHRIPMHRRDAVLGSTGTWSR